VFFPEKMKEADNHKPKETESVQSKESSPSKQA